MSDWGYSFDELTDMIAATLQTALDAEGKTDCILVSHDWGAVLSTMLQRKYPHLIRKLVMHDVEVQCYDAKWYSNGLLLPFVFFGWIYQYILASAFLVASIPVIGVPIGTMITHIVTQNQAAPLCQDAKGKHRTAQGTLPQFSQIGETRGGPFFTGGRWG